jgi:hypothetical protein
MHVGRDRDIALTAASNGGGPSGEGHRWAGLEPGDPSRNAA